MVAKELGIPVSMVRVKPTDNLVAPNNSVTGGSMGSECCASVSDWNSDFSFYRSCHYKWQHCLSCSLVLLSCLRTVELSFIVARSVPSL